VETVPHFLPPSTPSTTALLLILLAVLIGTACISLAIEHQPIWWTANISTTVCHITCGRR